MTEIAIISGGLAKLAQSGNGKFEDVIKSFFIPGEEIIISFANTHDGVVFTNKRIIGVDTSGLGHKKEKYTSIPYKKIDMFYSETAGVGDTDTELRLLLGSTYIHLCFNRSTDIVNLAKIISTYSV
ncbi:MAG: hypothetical protein ATN31_04665 [Candidatus Epulonipiscioides saccharophilum]|nr:MAG: hypothetical protein ATN31_04665 [Epulopiscium sp. AS2M-Bin001]